MKIKHILLIGIFFIIISTTTLVGYYNLEGKMPKFRSNNTWSWVSLCVGVGMTSYSVGKKQKK